MRFNNLFSRVTELLTLKCIHIKHFYPFIFAHKPLCSKFKADNLNINNIYFCRSCFFLYFGMLLAVLLYKNISIDSLILLIGLAVIIFLSNPIYYKYYSRITRDLARFFLGFLTVGLLLNTFYYNKLIFVYSIVCLFAIKHLYNIQRKKIDICHNCSELNCNGICSGYRLQADAILDIEDEMSNYMMNRSWRQRND